jgi:hypothetical protein
MLYKTALDALPALGSRAACSWCGKFFALQRRAQRYCSAACQKTGRRAELAVEPNRSRTLTQDTAVGGFSPKNTSPINGVQRRQVGSSIPLNILGGGYRWPGATSVEPTLLSTIIEMEIGGRR